MPRLTAEQVKDVGKCQRLLPKESDFIGRKGYERKTRKDGTYKWRFRYRPNVDGVKTKTQHEIEERMRPFMRADTERHTNLTKNDPKAVVRDASGEKRYLDPALAERSASERGWHHAISTSGNRVERGIDGMLFKWLSGAWYPLGRWCISTPWLPDGRPKGGRRDGTMIGKGVQRDPDGVPWRWVAGEWRSVT